MAEFIYETIYCKSGVFANSNVDKTHTVVKCIFDNHSEHAHYYHEKAHELASKVNPNMANHSDNPREQNVILIDAFTGLLAEHACYHYIKKVFGKIVRFTEYESNGVQIDLMLDNGKTIEVRSSMPQNGIQFAICNTLNAFRNVGSYTNLYKKSETGKDFFMAVLFENKKETVLTDEQVILYLVGGSTKEMMESSIAEDTYLSPKDNPSKITEKTKYRGIKLYDALDIAGLEIYFRCMGYKKIGGLD